MKPDWRILYVISASAVLIALLFDLQPLYLATKPLLMITLLLYFISASRAYPAWRIYVVIALAFSWAGDVFLMTSSGFIAGLVAFLIAHIFNIVAYHKTGAADGDLKPLDIIKFALYGSVLFWIIYPGLGDMLFSVLVYALVLLVMGVWAHKRRGATNTTSFMMVSTGAILFALSDGMIAVSRFAFEIPGQQILIMSTYIIAQYLIVQGLLKHMERT